MTEGSDERSEDPATRFGGGAPDEGKQINASVIRLTRMTEGSDERSEDPATRFGGGAPDEGKQINALCTGTFKSFGTL
jgi:hypothetical protein